MNDRNPQAENLGVATPTRKKTMPEPITAEMIAESRKLWVALASTNSLAEFCAAIDMMAGKTKRPKGETMPVTEPVKILRTDGVTEYQWLPKQ